jgi:protein-disulfide isomerase
VRGGCGEFIEYYNALYNGQSRTENSGFLANEQLQKFGDSVGITDPAFTRCVSSGRFSGWVTKNTDTTSQKGITGTPTVLVNGKTISNSVAADPERLTALVDQASS